MSRGNCVSVLRDIGNGKLRSCGLPHEIGRVVFMETTLEKSVRAGRADALSRQNQPKLEDQLRGAIRERHYSIRTEQAYVMWYRQFIRFHRLRHPKDMGEAEVTAFLKHLTVDRDVAVETHRQALNALVFLFRQVLQRELKEIEQIGRAHV